MTAPAMILRADASHRLGAGHVVRLAALAEAARAAGGAARIVVGGEPGALIDALIAEGHDVAHAEDDPDSLVRHAWILGADVVVFDGADVTARLAPAIAATGLTVAALDDGVGAAPAAPIVINPGFGAERAIERYPEARVALLGRRYAMLRRAFLAWPHGGPPRRGHDRLRVLVTFGGADPLGATPRALRALPAGESLQLVVVAGASYRHVAELDAAVTAAQRAGHVVERRGPVADMAALMASCDVCISGAGGTLAELAYLGRPAAAYAVAPDQVALAARLAAARLVHGGLDLATAGDDELAASLADFFAAPGRRGTMAVRAATTVDGKGAARIVAALAAA